MFGESLRRRISTKSLTRLAQDKEEPEALLRKQPFHVVLYGWKSQIRAKL